MTEKPMQRVCPYLGLVNDPASHLTEADASHRCYSPAAPGEVAADHQTEYCFSIQHSKCPRYIELGSTKAVPEAAPETMVTGRLSAPIPERSGIQFILLFVAVALTLFVFFLAGSFLFSPSKTPSSVVVVPTSTRTPLARLDSSPTPSQTPPATRVSLPLPTLGPLGLPTPSPNGSIFTLLANPERTGWVASKEQAPHWNESNLLSGSFQNQLYTGVLQFDLTTIPPGSKITFAALELTGQDASHLGTLGEWQIELVDGVQTDEWLDVSFEEVMRTRSLAMLGQSLPVSNLAAGYVNRMTFNSDQLKLLESQLEYGSATFRVQGPASVDDNVFTWEAGSGGAANPPTLNMVVVPAPYIVVTSTPTPANVLTAAAVAMRATALAREQGTPTRLRSGLATATPDVGSIVVTPAPTPANAATVQYLNTYATAVAMTTGTFTPTPSNWVTATPLPLLIPLENLTPVPTPTPTVGRPSGLQLARMPLPAGLYNKIAFLEGNRFDPKVWVMDPDGTHIALLTNRQVYDIAKARDALAPDNSYYIAQDDDGSGGYLLWMENLRFPAVPARLVVSSRRGLVYGPAWAPDGTKFAYTSNDSGTQEIWVYTLSPQSWQRLTYANEKDWWWNQFPSYSPDGKKIAYSSDCEHDAKFSEIWIMNADGGGAYRIGNGVWDAYAPVWIKWNK